MEYFLDFSIVGIALILAGHFWIILIAFQVNFSWGLICMWIGWIGPSVFAIEHFKKVWFPLALLYIGTGLLFFDIWRS